MPYRPTDLHELVPSLRRLADDLERIASGEGPTEEELWAAPSLDGWRPTFVETRELALAGIVAGHPMLPDGRSVNTSRLLAIDPHGRWARTWSRVFRLDRMTGGQLQ